MKLNSLQDLYLEQLKDLYDAEQQIIKALPKMIEEVTSKDLEQELTQHLNVTKTQATRLEKIFAALGEEPEREKCQGMKGVIEEGNNLIKHIEDPDVRDAAIIASAQRVEHYEMAGYGTARTYAGLLGQEVGSQLLQQTLDEEKEADRTLTTLAEGINVGASKPAEGQRTQTSKQRKTA